MPGALTLLVSSQREGERPREREEETERQRGKEMKTEIGRKTLFMVYSFPCIVIWTETTFSVFVHPNFAVPLCAEKKTAEEKDRQRW